ncbi:GlxA family transcriptional regulator [Umezawaea endophytica]|uniref:Helix-turn-helix domain-containing protein n=1 Tax=Umezawaea endophytica TaxID=1654476 RepID=A0A9X2VPX8_9PSEU|nr:helix-turn-helix domain-containing protein [Umezawaea endophytica]MCS7480007.1 helix-turn-helix domain-containing protein [Umezawaea endophytica]
MRTVGVLLLPDSRIFDVSVVCEVWGIDRGDSGVPPFELRICAEDGAVTPLSPLGSMAATHGLAGLVDCDLVVVPGRGEPFADVSAAAVEALRAATGVVAGLCSGSFVLAAAGLLDGRSATTHWRMLDELTAAAPKALVRRDVLFTSDDPVYTSAGVLGGVDLCLHLVRRDHGAEVAATVARRMVMPPVREGDQRQYAEAPIPSRTAKSDMASTVDWAVERLADPIGVGDLARHAGLSGRTFHRAFVDATGSTPGRWLQVQRVRLAQRLLETTDLPVHRVAERAGLGTPANLRRRLHAELGVGPDAYRRTFRVAG